MNIFLKKIINSSKKGMTLIELLVVLSIFLVLTSITIFDYDSFYSSVSIQNLTNDIALSIRKAQSYAIGVREVNYTAGFDYGYGIHFVVDENSNPIAGSNKSFIIFSDISGNDEYNYTSSGICGSLSSTNECEEILSINSLDYVSAVWIDNKKKNKGILDIVFKRPNPDAIFCYKEETTSNCKKDISYVKIEISNGLSAEKEIIKTITVWNTGQIGVN